MLWSSRLLIIASELAVCVLCARWFIPVFRRLKTGRLELYIGDRFRQDGSEPKFGGAVMLIAMTVGGFLSVAALDGRNELSDSRSGEMLLISVACAAALSIPGFWDDYLKDVRKSNVGIKMRYRLMYQFAVCLTFIAVLDMRCGFRADKILLPFRWGYIDLKALYYPLAAVGMVIVISAVKLHDCFGGDVKSGCDGLCAVTVTLFSLAFAVYGLVTGKEHLSLFSYVTAAASGGFLVWGLSPAKLYEGESGALLLGGAVACMTVISDMPLVFFMAGLGFIADGICTLLQYAVFKRSKKLLLKGNSLHAHLKAKGRNDYGIIIIFSCMTLIGSAVGTAFAVYSTKL